MDKVYNCSDCDFCYMHICVNENSDMLGQPVDWLGLAEEDMECVVVDGKEHNELFEEDFE